MREGRGGREGERRETGFWPQLTTWLRLSVNLCSGRLTNKTTRVDGSHFNSIHSAVVQLRDVVKEDTISTIITDTLRHDLMTSIIRNSHCITGDGDSSSSSLLWRLPLHNC